MNSKRLPEKDPGETIILSWDFGAELDPDDPQAIIMGVPETAIVVDTSLRRGEDPDVEDCLIGLPEVATGSKIVAQAMRLGVDGVDYRVRCAVDVGTIPGARLVMSSIVPVRRQ